MISDNVKKVLEGAKDKDLNTMANAWHEVKLAEDAIKSGKDELKGSIMKKLDKVGKQLPGKDHVRAETDDFILTDEVRKSYKPDNKFLDKVEKAHPDYISKEYVITPKTSIPKAFLKEMEKYFDLSVVRTIKDKELYAAMLTDKTVTAKDLAAIQTETHALKVEAK